MADAEMADTKTSPGEWHERASRCVRSIRFEADLALRRLARVDGRHAISFDETASAAAELQHWVGDERGDDTALSGRLAMLGARYRFICLIGAHPSDDSETDHGLIVDRLKALDSDAAGLLVDLGRDGRGG